MLGLSSSLSSGAAALKSIVRSGLQLFYKADRTQAPLGEEQIRNNSFDEISSNLVSNPTFDLGSEEVQNGSFDELGPDKIDNGNFETGISGWSPNDGSEATITYNSQLKGIKFSNAASGGSPTVRNVNSNTVTGETYKLTYKVLENNNASKISIWNGSTYSVYDDLPVNVSDDEHVYYYTFSGSSAPDLYIKLETNDSDITLSNIKLEKVDPNDNWELNDGWGIEEGKAICDGTQTGNTGLKQLLSSANLVSGRTYKLSYTISNYVNGVLNPHIRGNNIGTVSGNGDKVAYIVAGSSTSYAVNFYAGSSFNAEISNVSVKEVPSWELGDGWSIVDGKASNDGHSGANNLRQRDILTSGKSYQITIEVSDYVSGNVQVSAGGLPRGTMTANGTYTFNQTSNGTSFFIVANSFIGSVDNVSVKQLDPNNRWAVQNADTSAHTVEIREGEAYINYDHDAGTQGSTGINQSGVFPNTTSKYEIEVELGEVTGQLKIQTRGVATSINSSDSNTTKVILLDSSADSQTVIYIVRISNGISGSAFVKSVSVKEITNSIKDHSRNSNDGILYSGKALEFDTDDGSNDFIVLNDANLPGEFTVCTWVEPHSFTQCNIFGDDANENWIRIHSALSIKVKINDIATGYSPIAHGGNIALNKWSRVVVTRGSDNIIRFGINGTLYSPSSVARAGNFSFNRLGVKESLEMNGALADVQVYDKAWNATDVKYDWENPDKDVFDRVGEAQVLGEELNDLSWVANVGWSINGDIASGTGSTITNDILELGKTYQFKCKLSSYTSGDFRLMLGGNTISTNFSSTDEFTFIGVCAGDTSARVQSLNGGIGSLLISSLTIKEVTTHASHILPTDCKSLLRLNEGAGDRVYDAAPVLGAEEVTNGDFATDLSNWTIELGDSTHTVTHTSNGARFKSDTTTPTLTFTSDTANIVSGRSYEIKVVISEYQGSNGIKIQNSATGNVKYLFDSVDTFTYNFTAVSNSSTPIQFYRDGANVDITIESVSLKEIKPAESFFITGDKNFIHQQPYIPQYAMSSFSKKMVFDGSNDYVTGSFNGNIGPAEDITFSCWFSYEDSVAASGDRETLFGLLSSSADGFPARKFEVGLFETNRIVVYTGDGTTATSSSTLSDISSPLSNNKLNNVVVSLSSNGVVGIYVNGVKSATATHTNFGAPTITHYRIGSRTNTSLLNKGIIDEVSLFKSELTQAEVLELYNSGSSFDSTGHSKYNLGEEVSNGTFELGSEEVVNGDFSDGTTSGWSFSNLTADVSNNTLKLTSTTSADNRAFYDISTQVGKTYQMSVDVKSDASNSISGIGGIGVTNPITFQDGANAGSFTTLKLIFTATLETTQIRLLNSKAGTWGGLNSVVEFDNISVKEIPNWSFANGWGLNGNTAVYNGTGAQYAKLIQTLNTHVGRTYQMTFTLSGLSSGKTVNFGLGRNGAFIYQQQTYSSNGTYTRIMQAQSIDDDIIVQINQADANCTVSNISVQEYGVSGYWRNNGADQWDDLSINSNHGTVSGSPTEIFLQEVPFFGKDSLGMFMNKPRLGGLNFNGSGYVNGGNDSTIKPTSALSVECWIRTPDVSVTGKYVSDADVGATRFFLMQVGSKARFKIATTEIDSAANLTDNTWHYIAGTWNGSTMTLYVDEETPVTVSKSGSISYDADDLYIGTRLGTGEYYDGIIDDVRIYNEALTLTEIKKNYNATKGRHKN